MEQREGVQSPLGAPHMGMDYFPVFDSRMDDSPKFRCHLDQWNERSKKFESCLNGLKEKLEDYRRTGEDHGKAARGLIENMEYLGNALDAEKGMEEISAPVKQFTEILNMVWTYHKESNMGQAEILQGILDEVSDNLGHLTELYNEVILARTTFQTAMEKFCSCKQSYKTSDPTGWSNLCEVTLLTRTAYHKVLSQYMVALRASHSTNMLKFMQKLMDFMLAEFSYFNYSTGLFKNIANGDYWDKLFARVRDERGTCVDSLKTYTRLQKHVQRKTHKMYLEDRELNGLMDVDPHLSVSRISDALQNVLSSYHPLANQEKKAFLRPLQQVFPNYDKDLFVKGKLKKARSMEWELAPEDGELTPLSYQSEADLEKRSLEDSELEMTTYDQRPGDTDVLAALDKDEALDDDIGIKRRKRVFTFGRKYSPLEARQKALEETGILPATPPIGRTSSANTVHKSSKYSPKGAKGLLKKARGFVGNKNKATDQTNGGCLDELGGITEISADTVEEEDLDDVLLEEPLEPVPPSWIKYGYIMVGEKPASGGKVKWSQRYCAVDSERGQLLHQTSEMENPERLCDLLLSNAKLCSSEHTDRDHCVRILSPKSEHFIQTLTQEAAKSWLEAINHGIHDALGSSSQQPTVPDAHLRILAVPGNSMCVDCLSKNVEWASINMGTALCIRCSGVHRSLGVHVSKIRSLQLDMWSIATVEFMESVGNTKANLVYEAKLKESSVERPPADASKEERAAFIKKKYIDKAFCPNS